MIRAIGDRRGLERVEVGATSDPDGAGDGALSAVCTRLVFDDNSRLEGGLKFIRDDGRWVPWEWLPMVGCQGTDGGYPTGWPTPRSDSSDYLG